MNRLLKTTVAVIFLPLSIIAAATVALWYFIPRQQVHDLITRELSSRLHQAITMSGFSLGLYPDLEFTARDLRIVDPPSSQEIAVAEKVRFDLDTRQLFHRRFVIETVTVASPRVIMSRSAAGTWNIEDAVRNLSAGTAARNQAQPTTGLEFKAITIKNGSITVSDAVLGKQVAIVNLAGTINLNDETATIDSASLVTPELTAEVSGTVSQPFSADPRPDIRAQITLRKEGLLADTVFARLPAGSTIGDVRLTASGSAKALAIKTSFSVDPRATAGLATRGTLTGTLAVARGLCTIDILTLYAGKSTFSLSGNANNLWHKERSARLTGTASLSLDESIPRMENNALATIGLKGQADARINLTASSGQTNLSGTIDLSKAAFSLPNLMSKESGNPASLLFDVQLSPPAELIINTFELMIGENRITGTAQAYSGAKPRLQASLLTSSLALTVFNQLPAVRCEGGDVSLAAQVWHTGGNQHPLQYRAQALMQDAKLALNIMQEPFHKVNAPIAATNDLVVIPRASFFLGDAPCLLHAEIANFKTPEITGQLYTNTLDVDALIRAFRKPGPPSPEAAPEPGKASPRFSLDMTVDTASLCFGKLRTGAVSAMWHTSGRLQQFEPLHADLFGGTLHGALYLSFQKGDSRWHATFTGEELDIESLCAQFFTGETTASAKGLLNARGRLGGNCTSNKQDAWKSLGGNLTLSVVQGEIRQSPLFNSILLALRVSQGLISLPGISDLNVIAILHDVAKSLIRTLDVSRMVFKSIGGSFRITDGIARTEDLYFVGDTADFAFTGAFDLVRQEMDITIHVIPTGTLDSLVSKIPIVGGHLDRAKRATLSFKLTARGPFGNPNVQLQAVDKFIPGNS